jgi:hypothetical protein
MGGGWRTTHLRDDGLGRELDPLGVADGALGEQCIRRQTLAEGLDPVDQLEEDHAARPDVHLARDLRLHARRVRPKALRWEVPTIIIL